MKEWLQRALSTDTLPDTDTTNDSGCEQDYRMYTVEWDTGRHEATRDLFLQRRQTVLYQGQKGSIDSFRHRTGHSPWYVPPPNCSVILRLSA